MLSFRAIFLRDHAAKQNRGDENQWFSIFLILWPFKTAPHVVVTPTITIFFVIS